MATATSEQQLGALLRQWRERRRLSQLELALEAGISARHLSFVETGRSKPGRNMLLRVLGKLDAARPTDGSSSSDVRSPGDRLRL